jgi:hypothetical protein
MRRAATLLLATLLLLAGCASGDQPIIDEAGRPDAAAENIEDSEKTKESKGNSSEKKEESRSEKRKPGDGSREEASAGGNGAEGGRADEDRDEGGPATGGSGTRNAAYPAAGTYQFAQSGYEEFCDSAGRCDRNKLPSRQPVTLRYEDRSGSSATVVTEQKASDSRVARTWTRFTPSGAHITKVYVLMEYSGFRFERTYVPEPAVEAMRFPFTSGESWSGRWQASTSGSYSVKVGVATKTEVGGRGVTAYRIDTSTEFRGDFQGKSSVTAYYDVDTKALIAAEGVLNVTSQFGRYSTAFDTNLLSGPGY